MARVHHIGLFPIDRNGESGIRNPCWNEPNPEGNDYLILDDLTDQQRFDLFWRVREVEFYNSLNGLKVTVLPFGRNLEFETGEGYITGSEEQLVIQRFGISWFGQAGTSGIATGSYFNLSFTNGFEFPYLYFNAGKLIPTEDPNHPIFSVFDSYDNGSNYPCGSINVKFLDYTKTLTVYGNTFVFGQESTLPNFSVNGYIKAVEYWEYDPNDGKGPKYDLSTGEQIRFDV